MVGKMSTEKQLIKATNFVGVTCELADEMMQDRLGRSYEDYLLGNDDEGYSYTEEGQDIFNEILIEVEIFLAKLNVVNESINFKGEEK